MKTVIKVAATLLIISMGVACILSVVNFITAPVIEKNNNTRMLSTLSKLFPDAETIEFEKIEFEYSDSVSSFYRVNNNGEHIGYYAQAEPVGFKGEISIIVALGIEGNVCGIEILSHTETPGIGTEIEERSFLDRFLNANGNVFYKKGGGEGYIDGISGATYSSKAVIEGVDAVLETYKTAKETENK